MSHKEEVINETIDLELIKRIAQHVIKSNSRPNYRYILHMIMAQFGLSLYERNGMLEIIREIIHESAQVVEKDLPKRFHLTQEIVNYFVKMNEFPHNFELDETKILEDSILFLGKEMEGIPIVEIKDTNESIDDMISGLPQVKVFTDNKLEEELERRELEELEEILKNLNLDKEKEEEWEWMFEEGDATKSDKKKDFSKLRWEAEEEEETTQKK